MIRDPLSRGGEAPPAAVEDSADPHAVLPVGKTLGIRDRTLSSAQKNGALGRRSPMSTDRI